MRGLKRAAPKDIFPLISGGGRLYWTCFCFQIRITANDACISYNVDKGERERETERKREREFDM